MLAALGDLVEDVVVRLEGPIHAATDTPASISRRRGGSAANVAVRAAELGHPSRFLGQVGSDTIGAALLDELVASGVEVDDVRRSGSTGTIVALVDPTGERSMLTDRQACIALDEPDPSWLDGVTVLHVPVYSLASEPIATTTTTVVGWAHVRGIPVSIDASSTSVISDYGVDAMWDLIRRLVPDVLFANADEAALLGLGRAPDDVPSGHAALANALLVVKQGPGPALVHRGGRSPVAVPATAVGAGVDTTGAGDAFAAGFLVAEWRSDPVAACEAAHRSASGLLAPRL